MPFRLPDPPELNYKSDGIRLPPCERDAEVIAVDILPNGGCLCLVKHQGNFFYFHRYVEFSQARPGRNALLSFSARRYKLDSPQQPQAIVFSPYNESDFIMIFNRGGEVFGRVCFSVWRGQRYLDLKQTCLGTKNIRQVEWLSPTKILLRDVENRVEIFCLASCQYELVAGKDITYIKAITTSEGRREIFAIRKDGVLLKLRDTSFVVWTVQDMSKKALLAVASEGKCVIANNKDGEIVRFDLNGQKPPVIFGRDKKELLFLIITDDGQHMAYVKASDPDQFIVSSATTEGQFYKHISDKRGSRIVAIRFTDKRRLSIVYATSAMEFFDFYE